MPVGATLSDGTNVFVATEGQTTAYLTGWNLGNLVLDLPADIVGTLSLSVTATASEIVDGQAVSTASTSATMVIHVLPQVDDPQLADELYAAAATADSALVTLVVAGDTQASSGITIDWGGTLTNFYADVAVRTDTWAQDALGTVISEPSLAEQTGLVVQVLV